MRLLTNGMKIGKATVIVDIIPKGNFEIRPGTKMTPRYITEHDTGNNGRGADAEAHNKYIHNMAKLHPKDTTHVSWHITVDEDYIYQHIPFDETAWHCGDGANGNGNARSVGIEICMHRDQKDRNQAEENAIALTVYLMKNLNIPLSNVKAHQDWSGKFCPQVILKRDGSLAKFKQRIAAASDVKVPVVPNTGNSVHTVVKGDTLGAIAKKYNTTVADLQKLNKLTSTVIYVGQKLIVKEKSKLLFYLKSGTYATRAAAVQAAEQVGKLGIASPKYMAIMANPTGTYYWKTGSYSSEAAAENAKASIVKNKIAHVVHVVLV